jgi:hypothetical protein
MATEGDRDSTNRSSRTRILFASALELAIYIIPLIIIITIHSLNFSKPCIGLEDSMFPPRETKVLISSVRWISKRRLRRKQHKLLSSGN